MFSSPIFVFSYEEQSNVMAVIKDLHNRTGCKVLVSTSLALCVMSVFCIVLGILGSLTFPHLSSGNSFSSYSVETGVLRMACLLTCCFNAAMSYVFCISPCCRAAFMFLSRGNGTNISKKMCARLGAVLSSVCCILAIFLLDVAQVVSLLGAIVSSTLCMMFPALFAMQMRRFGTCLTPWVDALLPWVLLLKGLLFSATGTYMAFAFSSAGGTRIREKRTQKACVGASPSPVQGFLSAALAEDDHMGSACIYFLFAVMRCKISFSFLSLSAVAFPTTM
ncbi:amino_acid_permease_aap11ld-like_protein [Leishmania braziliensis MHOM/BR/75/M2904]|uniref:Amino_acid_permease_aap11ld-like_protein n=1 Tax=Leishmania braziliensis MHOM/BR/75/M2904 TaxID=420245 RepID=A0A3P3ZJV7_LEIBR|nr:unnamed protein product [Leishmania braziliensis]SYZ70551.1 amino_acid_permease_aap11ld-like_protein [Leishmania braziliensis MHOM/BR/75/M2904]